MADVILKGEVHTSLGDRKEERELLKQGVDALVLEGNESEAEYGWSQGWFSVSMYIFSLVFGELYADKDLIVDLAEAQDADIIYTREDNSGLLDNAPVYIKTLAAISFYILFPASILVGVLTTKFMGSLVLLLSALVPILLIRFYNMRTSCGGGNRDQIIADKINEATEGNRTVLAIVGERHRDGVADKLPEDIVPEQISPAYGVFSRQHAKDLIRPIFVAFSVLYVLYLIAYYFLLTFLPVIRGL